MRGEGEMKGERAHGQRREVGSITCQTKVTLMDGMGYVVGICSRLGLGPGLGLGSWLVFWVWKWG